jgi:hypothetical protein
MAVLSGGEICTCADRRDLAPSIALCYAKVGVGEDAWLAAKVSTMPAPTPSPHARFPALSAPTRVPTLAVLWHDAGRMLSLGVSRLYELMRAGETAERAASPLLRSTPTSRVGSPPPVGGAHGRITRRRAGDGSARE